MMEKITKKEVEHIARMSAIMLKDEEIPHIAKHLEAVLAYAERVQEIKQKIPCMQKTVDPNLRADEVMPAQNTQEILQRAPEREDNFFVVPSIIKRT